MEIKSKDLIARIELMLDNRHQTKKEFAEKCGFTYQSLVDWKQRDTIPSASIVYNMAMELNVPMEWLLTGGDIDDDVAVIMALAMSLTTEERKPIIEMLKAYSNYWRSKDD